MTRVKRIAQVLMPALVSLALVALGLVGLAPVGPVQAATSVPSYAPLDRPGPKLSVPAARLRASLECHGSPASTKRPVLLSPATSVTPRENYAWNYMKAFTAQGRYWCAVTMPHHTFGDIQGAGEYHVHAIRTMFRRTGKRISIVGHSQGGMNPRWALRFWPDTRAMVDDVIGMAPSNHGTESIPSCIPGVTTCTPAVWQQQAGARFIRALNSRAETFRGISYTNITSRTDEVVTPMSSSFLHTGAGRIANVPVQDICPLDVYEHNLVGTIDPTAYALVMDALNHRGPADPARIDRVVCGQLHMPYVDPAELDYVPMLVALPNLASTLLPYVNTAGAPMVKAEPRLRCYVFTGRC
ncbi:esterase/lipase family protein [Nocardioides sp. Root151]|uniref:esterase/lipase family protein n=1 Tax=Nocardioides sp. Root151 TaxID=1736475 RepID=UPI0012E3CB20|nr:lipase [Nocardioides sp. Root151]